MPDRTLGGSGKELGRDVLNRSEQQRAALKQVLAETGTRGPVTPTQQKLYAEMTALYPQEIILMAAKECAAKQSSFESVLKLLQSWEQRGFTGEKQISDHIRAFHDKEEYLAGLKQKWNTRDAGTGRRAMQMLDKWEDDLGFSREMISMAAEYAFEAKKPLSYMDSILEGWAEKGIRTPEAARKEKQAASAQSRGGKPVTAQQYEQRDYSGEQDEAMRRMLDMDGGKGHA